MRRLVMPEVITGLSLLLLFVALTPSAVLDGNDPHTTLKLCFVAVVVQARLGALDRSLEEARWISGLRSGAGRSIGVTLPLILPAIARAGCWRSHCRWTTGDRELHHRPGSATLPIRIYSRVRLGVKPENQPHLHGW